jgi:hypothetical protein
MKNAIRNKPVNSVSEYTNRLGFYCSILTTLFTVVTFGIAFNTPPLSGPYSIGPSFNYPYLDIASRFPRDYFWMFPALILTAIYVVLMICIYQNTPRVRKVFSQTSLAFALISAGILFTDYFLQLSVIQPSLVNGEKDGISILTQYNPHGIYIALEDLGYSLMSVSFLFLAPVFSGKNRVEKALRWIFSSNFILTISSLIFISVIYGIHREYRFEVAVISINWLSLIIAGILLSVVFRRGMRS